MRPQLRRRDHEWAAPQLGLDLRYGSDSFGSAGVATNPHLVEPTFLHRQRREASGLELACNRICRRRGSDGGDLNLETPRR